MKTPRDILFARHQTAVPKLDAIRQSTVAAVCDRRNFAERRSQTAATTIFQTIWLELVLPCRRIWTGLAAVWILIFIVNIAQRDPADVLARKAPASATEAMFAWRQQERMLAELMATTAPAEAEPRKTTLPRPRTESRDRISTV